MANAIKDLNTGLNTDLNHALGGKGGGGAPAPVITYATFDTVNSWPGTFTNDDKTYSAAGGSRTAITTDVKTSGKWAVEFHNDNGVDGISCGFQTLLSGGGNYVGSASYSFGVMSKASTADPSGGVLWAGTNDAQVAKGTLWTTCLVAMDLDTTPGSAIVRWYLDGSVTPAATYTRAASDFVFAANIPNGVDTVSMEANPANFVNSTLPLGYNGLNDGAYVDPRYFAVDYTVGALTDIANGAPVTFTRSTSQVSYLSGTSVTNAINAPAYSDRGLDMGSAATNSILYSDDLTDASWTASGLTPTYPESSVWGRSSTKLTGVATDYIETSAFSNHANRAVSFTGKTLSGTLSVTVEIVGGASSARTFTLTTDEKQFVVNESFGTVTSPKVRITLNGTGSAYINGVSHWNFGSNSVVPTTPTSGTAVTMASSPVAYTVSSVPSNDIFIEISSAPMSRTTNINTMSLVSDSNNWLRIAMCGNTCQLWKRTGGVTDFNTINTWAAPIDDVAALHDFEITISSTTGFTIKCLTNGESFNYADNTGLAGTISTIYMTESNGNTTYGNSVSTATVWPI